MLTGKPILPPKWVFEPWAGGGMGRWSKGPLKNNILEIVGVIKIFEELDIPHSALYAEGARPDAKLFSEAALRNIKLLSWEYPAISSENAAKLLSNTPFEELPLLKITGMEKFEKNPPSYIDFTHPKAIDLLRSHWKERINAGIAGTMVDFGDLVPDQAIFFNGQKGDEMHNFYLYYYTKSYNYLFKEARGDDFVLFQRGAAPGSQTFACCFAGDHSATFVGLTSVIYGGLSIAACGFPFWGSDIGGYLGFSDEDVYIRWVEFGCFSPIMRFHGTEPREPWEYSNEAVEIYKRYIWIRENLLDYSYSIAVNAHNTGIPMIRTLGMEFPDNRDISICSDQYFYGKDLMVAPVHEAAISRQVIFPPGKWVNLWNGEIIEGSCSKNVDAPLNEIPVFLRDGAVVPVRLNESLEWGMSMTKSCISALVITPPDRKKLLYCYETSTRCSFIPLTPEKYGFEVDINGRPETIYIIVYGINKDVIDEIVINGNKLCEFEMKQCLYDQYGWYYAGMKLIIHIPHSGMLKVNIRLCEKVL